MKRMFFLFLVMVAFMACKKEEGWVPSKSTTVELTFKSSIWENVLEINMPGVFQGVATNYSTDYPFLWIVNSDTTESYDLLRQYAFAETGTYVVTLVVFDASGNASSSSVEVYVVDQYIFPTEFRLFSSSLMLDGRYAYFLWVNLDYLPGSHEDYYWFKKISDDEWQETKIYSIYFDQNGVKWGRFPFVTYNQSHVWAYGSIVDGTKIFANIGGSLHYNKLEEAFESYFYSGSIVTLPFEPPALPGIGDNVAKVSKGQTVVVYFNFKDFSSYKRYPILEIKNGGGTVRREMTYIGGTGWAKATLTEDDVIDRLIIWRFGNYDDNGVYFLSDNPSSQWYMPDQQFLVLKYFEI